MGMSAWNKKRRIMRRFDQSAKVYDVQYCEEQEAKIAPALDNLTLNKNNIILDAGCGTGLLFEHVAQKTKLVVGTDISGGILREAKKKAKQYKNADLILADADNMPFCKHVFDVVFAITLLQNTPSPRATLNEIKRVTKSNAAIVVTGLKKAFTAEEFSKMLRQVNLKVGVMKPDNQMREYVFVCTKMSR